MKTDWQETKEIVEDKVWDRVGERLERRVSDGIFDRLWRGLKDRLELRVLHRIGHGIWRKSKGI